MINILDFMPKSAPFCEFYEPLVWHIPNIGTGYYLSPYGRLYYTLTNKYYPNETYSDKNKYITVYLRMTDCSLKEMYLHRLMMEVFCPIENSEKFEVNHKDGIRYHNYLWNLEWVTHEGNMKHAFETGLAKIGEDVPYSTITNEQAHLIAQKLSEGFGPTAIRNMLKDEIPNARIKQIAIDMANNQSWKAITSQYDMSNCYKNKPKESKFPFTDEQTHTICKLFEQYGIHVELNFILDSVGIDYKVMNRTEKGRLGAHISLLRYKKAKLEICSLYNY